jgi:flagellar hook-basal body complex protein FliE
MTDNKIGTIRPVAEPRAPEKAQRKEPVRGTSFEQQLEQANSQLTEVGQQAEKVAAQSDAKSIQDGLVRANEQFNKMQQLEQLLRQQYQNVTRKPTQDKS